MSGLAKKPAGPPVNPYRQFVSAYARFAREGKLYPLGGFPPAPRPEVAFDAPRALIFSPHPDDECITGGFALRLMRESRMNVVNVAVTQGNRQDRQAARFHELEEACHYLGFGLVATAENGLERVTRETREKDQPRWRAGVEVIAGILLNHQPRVIFCPHAGDWHDTHIGTHFLVVDALQTLPGDFVCYVVETEFWGAMDTPNLMVESSMDDVTDLVSALSFHSGEVRRNPYHLRLPAWLHDNVRRGTELVCGQGATAPDFAFATLYRLSRWSRGRLGKVLDDGRVFSSSRNPTELFP